MSELIKCVGGVTYIPYIVVILIWKQSSTHHLLTGY